MNKFNKKILEKNNINENNSVIFKKIIFDLKKNPLRWLNDKKVNPDNINFFHEIKYLF